MADADKGMRGMSARLSALGAETTGAVRSALLITFAISVVLLLTACANIMNLLFSRAADRGREIAVRKAVGATTWRLLRQMLVESACLTFFAGAIGVALARVALDALVGLSPAHLPVSGRIEIDWAVLSFAFLVCAGAAILAGVWPALHRSRQSETLIATTRSSASRSLLRFQRGLMVAQIALGVGLLAAAGLLAHSLFRLSSVNPGFRTQDVIAFELSFSSTPAERLVSTGGFSRRRAQSPESFPPAGSPIRRPNAPASLCRSRSPGPPRAPARSAISRSPAKTISKPPASPWPAAATSARPTAGAPFVAIINDTLARQYFPNGDPLGRRITTMFDGSNAREIIGVIHDIHDRGLNAKPVATVYVPYGQFTLGYGGVVARAAGSPESIIPEIRRRMALVDPTVPLKNLTTIKARLRRTLDAPRFYTILAVACAVMAVLFVTLGLYGVISYGVSRRTSEIGIRMALGAPRESILRGVLGQGLAMAAAGVALGIAISLAGTACSRRCCFRSNRSIPRRSPSPRFWSSW